MNISCCIDQLNAKSNDGKMNVTVDADAVVCHILTLLSYTLTSVYHEIRITKY